MRALPKIAAAGIVLGLSLPAHATAPCGRYDAIAPIPRNPAAETHPEEYFQAGFMITSRQRLDRLPSGRYVYLVDDRGHLMVSAAVPNLKARDHFVVSHRSLYNSLRARLEPADSLRIRAAGEFYVTGSGAVRQINNKSKTYPSDLAHLNHGVDRLREAGLPVDQGTRIVDFNDAVLRRKIPGSHAAAVEEAQAQLQMDADPKLREVLRRFTVLQEKLAKILPQNTHGEIDLTRLSEWVGDHPGPEFSRLTAWQILSIAESESPALSLWQAHQSNIKLERVLKDLEDLARELGPRRR